ncbi:hypothetical protein [Roseovarius indicus]|uniref:hypothetical protein n=1 Tax=Roseovarius indicus TaxID=540747 RepID=UPI0015A72E6D|nr:hypothetical protein [Roseovarius indicus]
MEFIVTPVRPFFAITLIAARIRLRRRSSTFSSRREARFPAGASLRFFSRVEIGSPSSAWGHMPDFSASGAFSYMGGTAR